MQLSELYRRGVIVPLDDESQAQLQSWNVNSSIRVEYLNLSDEDFFNRLIKLGIFKQINDALGLNIDDYEEEVIYLENLDALKAELARLRRKFPDKDAVQTLLHQLNCMADDAIRLGKSMYFIL